MARILGINFTQDASVCTVDTAQRTFSALRKERVNKKKHAWGALGDFPAIYGSFPQLAGPIELAVGVFSSDPIRDQAETLQAEVRGALDLRGDFVELSHHLAHLYSMLPLMTGATATAIVVDCMGSYRGTTDLAPVPRAAVANKSEVEILSVYRLWREGRHELMGKHFWSGNWNMPVGLGAFYYYLTRCFFGSEGSEGKVMALASYGSPEAYALPDLELNNGFEVSIPDAWLKAFEDSGMIRLAHADHASVFKFDPSVPLKLKRDHPEFRKFANLAAAGQRAFERALEQVVQWSTDRCGDEQVLFGGGTALNCAANGALASAVPGRRVTVPSWPDDGGTSIGAAFWGAVQLGQSACLPVISLDYLGALPGDAEGKSAADRDLDVTRYPSSSEPALLDAIAALLVAGKVVGLCSGKSEFGPRALGNRTLLADLRVPGMRDFINSQVKGREWFRPVAPLVLEPYAEHFFDVPSDCRFMQYAVTVKPDKASSIPSGVHVDGTARIQRLARADNPILYSIIERFHALTGIPMVINTSLNPKDMPIVETREEALDMLQGTAMDALVVEATLYVKRSTAAVAVSAR